MAPSGSSGVVTLTPSRSFTLRAYSRFVRRQVGADWMGEPLSGLPPGSTPPVVVATPPTPTPVPPTAALPPTPAVVEEPLPWPLLPLPLPPPSEPVHAPRPRESRGIPRQTRARRVTTQRTSIENNRMNRSD